MREFIKGVLFDGCCITGGIGNDLIGCFVLSRERKEEKEKKEKQAFFHGGKVKNL